MHPYALIVIYLAVGLAPIGLAWGLGYPRRPLMDELATILALVGYAMLLMEFVLSGRFQLVSSRVGIDATMRFHQRMAIPVAVLLMIHPFLYSLPFGSAHPWDVTGEQALGVEGWGLAAGVAAWALLGGLVLAAIFRDQLPVRYEGWRLTHGLGAGLVAGLGLFHALDAGRYSGQPVLIAYWSVLLAVALWTLVVVYLLRPLIQLRHPYHVASVTKIGIKSWEVILEPERGGVIPFKAGQFVWLTLAKSPFHIREHPFSIASAPVERGKLSFIIKEMGDFTNHIGELPVGAPAYIDGPHGALTLERARAKGVVLIAGGSGIAPVLSMLRQMAATGETRPVKLIYGNRVAEQILYREELEGLRQRLRLEVIHVLSEPGPDWQGEVGMTDATLLRRHLETPDRAEWLYVVCGPPPMINSVEKSLAAMKIPPANVRAEKFSYN